MGTRGLAGGGAKHFSKADMLNFSRHRINAAAAAWTAITFPATFAPALTITGPFRGAVAHIAGAVVRRAHIIAANVARASRPAP